MGCTSRVDLFDCNKGANFLKRNNNDRHHRSNYCLFYWYLFGLHYRRQDMSMLYCFESDYRERRPVWEKLYMMPCLPHVNMTAIPMLTKRLFLLLKSMAIRSNRPMLGAPRQSGRHRDSW